MQHMLRMGIDVGSTTVKVVLLDEHDNYLYKKYIRHYANILDTVYTLLQEAQVGHEDALVHVCITGSGGMAMAEKVRIPCLLYTSKHLIHLHIQRIEIY